MNQYRIVEYTALNEFFIYDVVTGIAHYIENLEDRDKLRTMEDIFVSYNGQRPLERVSINITGYCNMRCEHCYFSSILEPKELPIQTIADTFVQLYKMGVLQVGITGGEPTLHSHLPEIIQSAKNNKLFITLATNGVLMTAHLLRKLYNSGLRVLGISFDAINEDTHMKIRKGSNTWNPLLNNIKAIYDLDFVNNDPQFHINIATVMSKMNYSEMEDIFIFLNSLNRRVRWHINYINFIGNANTNTDFLILTKNEIVKKLNFLLQLAKNSNVVLSLGRFITEIGFIDENNNRFFAMNEPNYVQCCGLNGEFERFCVLNFDGYVYPCTNLVDQTIGNIDEDHFIGIWESEMMLHYKSNHIGNEMGLCGVCKKAQICQKVGICRCQTAILKFNRINKTAQVV